MAKGFLQVEIDGAVGRLTAKQGVNANLRARFLPVVTLATIYLSHLKKRIARGQFATRPKGYRSMRQTSKKSGKPRGFVVSELYAKRAQAPMGAATSADWHRKAGTKPGQATGELVKGLQARGVGSGAAKAKIDARGTSIGSSTGERIIKAGAKGNRRGKEDKRKVGKKVRNQAKLAGVWKTLRVNLVQPTDAEVTSMARTAAMGLHAEVFNVLAISETSTTKRSVRRGKVTHRKHKEVKAQLRRSTDRTLYERLSRQWVR